MRKNLLVTSLVFLSACVSAYPSIERSAGYSNRDFLRDSAVSATPAEIDEDLRRGFSGDGFAGLVTPLSPKLVKTVLLAQARKEGVEGEKREQLLQTVLKLLVEERSCFDFYVRGGTGEDGAKANYYGLSFAVADADWNKAEIANYSDPNWRLIDGFEKMLHSYVKSDFDKSNPRNLNGWGAYSRKTFCGEPAIDFANDFVAVVTPRFLENPVEIKLSWRPRDQKTTP
ncbi:MAG: hypothetical protein AAFY60_03940 [Myxococcota bacterium]